MASSHRRHGLPAPAPAAERLKFIYLANDVLLEGRAGGSEYLTAFQAVLPVALRETYTCVLPHAPTSPAPWRPPSCARLATKPSLFFFPTHSVVDTATKDRLERIVGIWRDRGAYPAEYTSFLERAMLHGDGVAVQDEQETGLRAEEADPGRILDVRGVSARPRARCSLPQALFGLLLTLPMSFSCALYPPSFVARRASGCPGAAHARPVRAGRAAAGCALPSRPGLFRQRH